MSRSRKKYPLIRDSWPEMRRISHRIYRSRTHQISKTWRKGWYPWDVEGMYDDPQYPDLRELVDQYDICDWWYIDRVNGYRK